MTEEYELLGIGDKTSNRNEDIGHQSEVSDSVVFLFTSESVGEGHPGNICLKSFLSNELIMQIHAIVSFGLFGVHMTAFYPMLCVQHLCIFKIIIFITDYLVSSMSVLLFYVHFLYTFL